MATNFPTGLDDFANYVDGTTIMEAALLNDMQFAIEALQAKVGIDNSGVSSSHDYKLANPGVQIKTGTYTGNGSATQAITGVGFQPAIIFALNNESNVKAFLKTDTMGLNTAALWLNGWYNTDYIISFDADGFTVGDGSTHGNQLNVNGKIYSYIAIGID